MQRQEKFSALKQNNTAHKNDNDFQKDGNWNNFLNVNCTPAFFLGETPYRWIPIMVFSWYGSDTSSTGLM